MTGEWEGLEGEKLLDAKESPPAPAKDQCRTFVPYKIQVQMPVAV